MEDDSVGNVSLNSRIYFNSRLLVITQTTESINSKLDNKQVVCSPKKNQILNRKNQIVISGFNNRCFFGLINYIKSYPYTFRWTAYQFFVYLYCYLRIKTTCHGKVRDQNSATDRVIITAKHFLDLTNSYFSILDTKSRPLVILVDFRRLEENDQIIRIWSSIVLSWLYKRIRYEAYAAYLSTFGGAYSSLGEDIFEHAVNAMQVSQRQLKLAMAFNEGNAICRCKLFLSFSLIQMNRLREANAILKNEFKFLKSSESQRVITDDRLLVMCIAGMKKLRFTRELNKKREHK